MGLFTQTQADDAYDDCTIKKTTQNSNQNIGSRCVTFTANDEPFCLDIETDVLAMSATPDEVKTFIVDKLKNEVEYPGVVPAVTEATEEKA